MSSETLSKKIEILGREIQRGESAFLELEVAKLHTRNTLKIPIIVERGLEDGPTLLLMGGVHGDEVNGVAIVRDVIQKGYNKPKRGTIICIPVLNVFGYLNVSREFTDGRDLNRVFPGQVNGSLASQFAYKFTKEIAPLVDYLIDFHTGGGERDNAPQIRCMITQPRFLELAQVFGAPFIIHSNQIHKSVRDTLYKMGKVALLFEGGKSKNLDEKVIACGVRGAVNVMNYLKLRDGEVEDNISVVIQKSKWLRAPYSGMLRLRTENGSFVRKKEVLGMITDSYADFEKKILAPFDCHVICANTSAIVNKGDALFHISTELM